MPRTISAQVLNNFPVPERRRPTKTEKDIRLQAGPSTVWDIDEKDALAFFKAQFGFDEESHREKLATA